MKCTVMIGAVVLMGLLVASPGSALQWEVKAYVFATEKPTGPQSSYVWSRGVHQLLVTHVRLIDSIIPFRYRISAGQLSWEGAPQDSCGTSWRWSWSERFFQECKTYTIQESCHDGFWSAEVTGRLDIHPSGGTRTGTSGPKHLQCACS